MSGECSRHWIWADDPYEYGAYDQPDTVCPKHGEAPYFQDEWYGDRWQVADEAIEGMAFGCLDDDDLRAIGETLRTAVAAWETEATKRGLNIETTTEENNG